METTNSVYDSSILTAVTPDSALSWLRSRVASRAARTAAEWAQLFDVAHSGTYASGWMALDLAAHQRSVAAGEPVPAGVFWLYEEVPGYSVARDLTRQLVRDGYFGSYNIPHFLPIYWLSGAMDMYLTHGDYYSLENCPRALLFDRLAPAVAGDVEALFALLRYNEYQTDPECQGHASWAIASRYDLPDYSGLDGDLLNAFGAIDAKASSSALAKGHVSYIQSGPTYDQQPVFCWHDFTVPMAVPHTNQPDCWDFPTLVTSPDGVSLA
eukprot:gnl/Ergobibamus_cyprinoides/323.p1 GENE.gnl/Ergobibamus_cyprinoides/323~~gnl/Ergobibamus_cyprinoides/323.p1  ORF type:complete len:268 (+),score=58.83 gnl/Ergobibamus_cyprinoides/323:355-1158(+)